MKELQFKGTEYLSMENSFGVIRESEKVELNITFWFHDGCIGYELYDDATDGDEWYAEGYIQYNEDNEIEDYDGVFSLPDSIIEKLKELGYNTEYLED